MAQHRAGTSGGAGGADRAGGAEHSRAGGGRHRAAPGPGAGPTAQVAIRRAVAHVQEMTGRAPGEVIGLERDARRCWIITVETPSAEAGSDAQTPPIEHSVHLDPEGDPISCRRADHYVRDRVVGALDRGFALNLGLGAEIAADIDIKLLGRRMAGLQVRGALTPQPDGAGRTGGSGAANGPDGAAADDGAGRAEDDGRRRGAPEGG